MEIDELFELEEEKTWNKYDLSRTPANVRPFVLKVLNSDYSWYAKQFKDTKGSGYRERHFYNGIEFSIEKTSQELKEQLPF